MEKNDDFIYTAEFLAAQSYELASNNNYTIDNYKFKTETTLLLNSIKEFKKSGEIIKFSDLSVWDFLKTEFFNDSIDEFEKFITKMKDKNNLEVGCGPCGLLNSLYWFENRTIIDPLIDGYKQYQLSLYGESWFNQDGLICYSKPAETTIESLVGKIDGFVICRNCIDHTQDWRLIMENIGKYSAIGSYFLFWSDLFHFNGTDSGHFNITNDKGYFREYVKTLGYEIESEWEMPENERHCINIGFIAKKIK